jgi:hypothetical protein
MPAPFLGVDRVQAEFWNGALTRKEAQEVFDSISENIKVIAAKMTAYDMSMAFVFAKLGIQKEEFEAFVKAKMEQIEAAEQAAANAQGKEA